MRSISYDGVGAVTTDGVAEALLELAIVVAQFRRYESATFPVDGEGRIEQLALMLGRTIHLSTLTISTVSEVAVAGAEEAAAELRRRARVFTDPLHVLEIDLQP